VILECCVCNDAATFDQLETWTKTTQVMEKWPPHVRERYTGWLIQWTKYNETGPYEDTMTGLLVDILCKEHRKQLVEEAGLLVSWSGLDALVPLDEKRDKYGPTFHVGPYMLQSRIYQRKWTVCSQGHPNALVSMPYDYEAVYGWFDSVWESTKLPPEEANAAEVELATKLKGINGYHKLSHAGQVRASLVLGKEPPKWPTRQHRWRVTVASDAISMLGGYDPYPGIPHSEAKTAVQRLIKLAYPGGPPDLTADPGKPDQYTAHRAAVNEAWDKLLEDAKQLWPDK
jgi:hypothetical protein